MALIDSINSIDLFHELLGRVRSFVQRAESAFLSGNQASQRTGQSLMDPSRLLLVGDPGVNILKGLGISGQFDVTDPGDRLAVGSAGSGDTTLPVSDEG